MKYLLLILLITATSPASVAEKKQRFLKLFVPAITKVYNERQNKYKKIKENIKYSKHPIKIQKLMKKYKVTTNNELLKKLKPHPISIALAQAALESDGLHLGFLERQIMSLEYGHLIKMSQG